MYFIRNLKAQDAKDGHVQQIEYEISTDGETIGEIRFGPYFFTIWEFARKRDGQPRKLLLRVREVRLGERPQASKKGYYHGGDLADEIAALASLFLRRRFQVNALVRRDEQPLMIARERDDDDLIDRALVSGTRNLEHLGPWFDHVVRFEPKLHLALMLAVRMYHCGILQIEDAPDLAYLNFVSAIEVLCHRHPIPPVPLEDVDAGLAAAVMEIAEKEIREAVARRIVDRERFIGKRFVQFILDHTDARFWDDPSRPAAGKIDPKDLPDLLKRIYNARSKLLHAGEPLPASAVNRAIMGEEIDFSLGSAHGDRKWEPSQFIPHVGFFERLTNFVLMRFVERNPGK